MRRKLSQVVYVLHCPTHVDFLRLVFSPTGRWVTSKVDRRLSRPVTRKRTVQAELEDAFFLPDCPGMTLKDAGGLLLYPSMVSGMG